MNRQHKPIWILVCLLLVSWSVAESAWAAGQEPGWSMRVIATGDFRRRIQATPIEYRPYRPLHVYGNTIRRMHHRGTPLPLPRILTDRRNRSF